MKCIIVALALCTGAFAQNMNPTVTVTNRYDNGISDYQMQTPRTLIPDSLYHFDLNFNYTGFDIEYKGNDAFNPIHTELDMSTRPYEGKNFSMKAAGGYAVPVLVDINAVLKSYGRFRLGCFASNDSFWGRYDRILPYEGNVLYPDSKTLRGFDSRTKIGLDGRWDWQRSYLMFDVKYDGIHSSINETGLVNMYNSAVVNGLFRYRSDGCFRMGIDAGYAFGGYEAGAKSSPLTLMENIYKAGLSLSFTIAKVHGISLEGSFRMTDAFGANQKGASFGGYTLQLSPIYYFYGDDVFYVGAGVSLLYSASVANVTTGADFTGFPYLKLRWKAHKDYLTVYADASLDGEVWGVGSNARENVFYVADSQKSIVKNYKTALGFKGAIAGKLYYDVHAGYSDVQNAPLCAVTMSSAFGAPLTYVIHEKDLRSVNAGAEIRARFGCFSMTADALYRYFINAEQMTALPSWMEASADLKWDIRKRAWIHVGAAYKSDYKAGDYKVPYYVDLKAGVGFNIRKSFAVFVEGANLLNYSRQNVPLYSRSGFELTAGIKLLL